MSVAQDAKAPNTDATWTKLGPIAPGGTVFGVAVSPLPDVRRFWIATGCGVFVSDDEGETWGQVLNGLATPLLSALAVAPNGALLAGALDGGLFSSFDYGVSWEPGRVAPEFLAPVKTLAMSPNFAKDGSAFAATDGAGLLASRSSGRRWEDSGFGLGDDVVWALAVTDDWSERETMFASTSEGVFVSHNGGRAWRETELLLEDDTVSVLMTSPSYSDDKTVWAATESGALYRSTNGGRTWDLLVEQVGDGPVNGLWAHPAYAENGRVVAAVGAQIWLSDDGGESWRAGKELPGAVLSLGGDRDALLAGLHADGVWLSTDGGETWMDRSAALAARGFAKLATTEDAVYALGPQEGLWASCDQGASWAPVEGLPAYQALTDLAVGDAVLIADQGNGIVRGSQGDWSLVSDVPNVHSLLWVPETQDAWAGTGDGRLLKSEDGGVTWDEMPSPCEGQPVLSMVASPNYAEDHTLLMGTSIPGAGTREARVALWRSTNRGEDWRQLTAQTTDARWLDIALPEDDPDAINHVVMVTDTYCLRPLLRAKDVWISTTVDPRGANALSVVAVGPVDAGGELYVASGNGVHASTDGGRTWHPHSEGLEAHSFVNLAVTPTSDGRALLALSLGGVLYRLPLA